MNFPMGLFLIGFAIVSPVAGWNFLDLGASDIGDIGDDALAGNNNPLWPWSGLQRMFVGLGGKEGEDNTKVEVQYIEGKAYTCFPPPNIPWKTYGPAGGVFQGRMMFCGGKFDDVYLKSCARLNPKTNVWDNLPDMNEKRYAPAGVVTPYGFLVIGGNVDCGNYLNTTEYFDGVQWIAGPTLPNLGVYKACAVQYSYDQTFVFGGYGPDTVYNSVYRLDWVNGRPTAWTPVASMRSNRYGFGCVVNADNEILVTGGKYDGEPMNTTEIYNPITNTWKDGPELPSKVSRHVTALVNGKPTNFGGKTSCYSTEITQLDNGSWKVLSEKMGAVRDKYTGFMATIEQFNYCTIP